MRAFLQKQLASAQWIFPVLILLLGFTLRLYQLGDKGLWGDEIVQAKWALFPLAKLWQDFRDPPDFILHFLFGHFAQQLGRGEFWARLPSFVTSLFVIPAVYVTARRFANPYVALLAMLLVALSPFQIWYAQDARMYATLVCAATFSLYFFLRLLDEPRWRFVVGLTIANTGALYTHLFGVMPLMMEGVALGGIVLCAWLQARAARENGKHPPVLFSRRNVLIGASFVVTILLALPLAPGTLPYLAQSSRKGLEAAFGERPFQLSPQFMQLLLSDLGLGPDKGWRMWISFALALLGFGALLRTNLRAAWIAGVWLGLPLLLLQIAQPGHTVANRYLIFLQPVYLILIARGIVALAHAFNAFMARVFKRRAFDTGARRALGASVIVALLLLLSMAPLQALYRRAKLNDWQSIARFFETHTQPGDMLFVEKDFWGMNTLAYYFPNMRAFSSPPATLDELQKAFAQNRTMWYMSFGGYLNPAQEAWVKQNLTRVDDSAWMRSDLDYMPRDEFHFTQSEPLLAIYTRAGEIPSEIIYANELGDRPRATPFVPLKRGEVLEVKLRAPEDARVLVVEYAKPADAQLAVQVNGEGVNPLRTIQEKEKIISEYALPENARRIFLVQLTNDANKPFQITRLALE